MTIPDPTPRHALVLALAAGLAAVAARAASAARSVLAALLLLGLVRCGPELRAARRAERSAPSIPTTDDEHKEI